MLRRHSKWFHQISRQICHSHSSVNQKLSSEILFDGLVKGDRASLARGITLIESSLKSSKTEARKLLSLVNSHVKAVKKETFRIGLSGPPGAGKSTFIETFGTKLTEKGHKVAVLAVDPSSVRRGGSLLGDKTRMTELSRNPNAYIRPSPNRGHLGGVARTTNESILLCEAAGYDIVLVETVGVGQSEYLVSDMVDSFCLILSPAGGDELQGIKRGIIELCDLVLINKCDGDLVPAGNRTKAEYTSALKLIQPKTPLWRTQVLKMSSKHEKGIDEVWETLLDFKKTMISHGQLERLRAHQQRSWMWHYIQTAMQDTFKEDSKLKDRIQTLESQVIEGAVYPGVAADILMNDFWSSNNKSL